jgi:predicted helicase
VEAAQAVKEMPILVITGNPPYSGHSKNKGEWITSKISTYREGFPELSKPAQGKWLQDDYVKFIRFAQWKMESVEEGVVAVITNHSWLDNPTFKGMRKSLIESFDEVSILDLHGSLKRMERAPDGSKDENVFDIEQGVAISIFTKKSSIEKRIRHGEVWGMRLSKYNSLASNDLGGVDWTELNPSSPDWLLKPQDLAAASAYRELLSVREIFGRLGDPAPGFVTTHDQFAISFSPEEAKRKIQRFLATEDEAAARRIFRLCSQSQWSYQRAKDELPAIDLEQELTRVLYRPFDHRWTVWDRNVAVHRRERAMRTLREGGLALVTSRLTKGENFRHVQVSEEPVEAICMSPLTSNNGFAFPLYVDGIETFSSDFRDFIDDRYSLHYSPQEIFGYIYAVLHAPTYRARYDAFLRLDFPRIPFPGERSHFEALSALGWELVQAHLLKALPQTGARLGDYFGKGDHVVEAVRYSPEERTVWINKAQGFANVSQEVWDFHIGGYQVLEKYLRSRKGRTLSLDEQTHVGEVAEALAFTIAQMARIDEAYLAAFPTVDNSAQEVAAGD